MPSLQQHLLSWFLHHGRDLPWRRTYDPYHVWISEIMLQQTQMDRAVVYFKRWMMRFPDIGAVARGTEEEILKLWEGLGYYSRARNIRKTAALLIHDHGGQLPDDHAALLALPGIGTYTAAAIMSLAFNRDYPVVDGNVERVFARVFDLDTPVKEKTAQTEIRRLARELLPHGEARWFNQALMELGALICTPRSPQCSMCPIRQHCEARRLDIVAERPVTGRSPEIIPLEVATGVLCHQGRIFIQKRPETGVWANLWEFPGGRIEPDETPATAVVREFLEETEFVLASPQKLRVIRHGYTRYRVTLHCFACWLIEARTVPVLHAAQEYRWVRPEELAHFAFPAGHRKLIDWLWSQHSPASNLLRSLTGSGACLLPSSTSGI